MSFVDTNFMSEFWMFLLKTGFLIHNFWIVYTEVKMGSIGIYILFCFIWDPTLLYLDKTVFTRYPYIKIRLYINPLFKNFGAYILKGKFLLAKNPLFKEKLFLWGNLTREKRKGPAMKNNFQICKSKMT